MEIAIEHFIPEPPPAEKVYVLRLTRKELLSIQYGLYISGHGGANFLSPAEQEENLEMFGRIHKETNVG